MELGPKNHTGDGLLGPNSLMVVYMDPLGTNLFVRSLKLRRVISLATAVDLAQRLV